MWREESLWTGGFPMTAISVSIGGVGSVVTVEHGFRAGHLSLVMPECCWHMLQRRNMLPVHVPCADTVCVLTPCTVHNRVHMVCECVTEGSLCTMYENAQDNNEIYCNQSSNRSKLLSMISHSTFAGITSHLCESLAATSQV